MLNYFLFSVNSVLPVFSIILFGFYFRQKKILSEKTIDEINNVVFFYALPLMLFQSVYNSGLDRFHDAKLILWAISASVLCFVFLWVFAEIYLKDRQHLIGSFVQGSFRGNYAIIALPLLANILQGENTGKGALIVTFVIPVYNVLSVVVLASKNTDSQEGLIKNTISGICKNPLIHAILCGIILSALKIKLPVAVATGISYMASLGTPLALLAVGGSFTISGSVENLRPAIIASLLKTLFTPVILVLISIFVLGFRGERLAVLFVLFSTPTAVSSYMMASKMGSDENLAANILILSTAFSVVTFTLGIYLLKVFQFI